MCMPDTDDHIGQQIVLGHDTSHDGDFIDAHHPSLYVNIADRYHASTAVMVHQFRFYARSIGNPITPLVLGGRSCDDLTVAAIGTTRTAETYVTGENHFQFSDGPPIYLDTTEGDMLFAGFMDANADGSGWGAGPVIPADTTADAQKVFDLLPEPLVAAVDGFISCIDTPKIKTGERIHLTNAIGLKAGSLKIRGNLQRNYKFAVQLAVLKD